MTKSKSPSSNWVRNLRSLMEQRGFNPRSLSLKAGLNPTAVRDMFEGRTKFPRYDTARSLANALDSPLVALMGDADAAAEVASKGPQFGDDLELLTEIITRLQEVTEENNRRVSPRDFAAMTATLYHRLHGMESRRKSFGSIRPQIHDLLDYEKLRTKSGRKNG